MPTWKVWKWFRKKQEKTPQDKKDDPPGEEEATDILPAKNAGLVTTESGLELVPIKVYDDHTIKWKKKKLVIKPDRPAHIFKIPAKLLVRNWFARRFTKPYVILNTYTFQQTGELTHDPHLDQLTEETKMKFEKLLGLMGKFAEVEAGKSVYEGMKDKPRWWDYIPYIAIVAVVFLFLFAYFK